MQMHMMPTFSSITDHTPVIILSYNGFIEVSKTATALRRTQETITVLFYSCKSKKPLAGQQSVDLQATHAEHTDEGHLFQDTELQLQQTGDRYQGDYHINRNVDACSHCNKEAQVYTCRSPFPVPRRPNARYRPASEYHGKGKT